MCLVLLGIFCPEHFNSFDAEDSVHENHWTHRTFPMARPKCLMRGFTNLNRIYKAHRTNVWWIMKVFRVHCWRTEYILAYWVNAIPTDALAPEVARATADMLLTAADWLCGISNIDGLIQDCSNCRQTTQYHACWSSCFLHQQIINSHGIDCARKIASYVHHLLWNDKAQIYFCTV